MEQIYLNYMHEIGYKQLVCDIFLDWENVKDEILLPDRKTGTGNGTIHVFLGAADYQLQKEFPTYYDAVGNGEDPAIHAVKIKHFFLLSNIISMTGYVGQYYYNQNHDFSSPIASIFSALKKYPVENGLLSTTSYFKTYTESRTERRQQTDCFQLRRISNFLQEPLNCVHISNSLIVMAFLQK